MINAATYSMKGESQDKTKLTEKLFGVEVKPALLAQAVRVFLANQRQAQAKTKTRGEVAKTTAKMYRQKGTGRARHGSYGAPIFVGGGIAHGPTGDQNYTLKLPGKMRQKALLGALSQRAKEGAIAVISGMEKGSGKTKDAVKFLKKINNDGQKTLVILAHDQTALAKAWKNIPGVETATCNRLNTYIILSKKQLLFTPEALSETEKLYVD